MPPSRAISGDRLLNLQDRDAGSGARLVAGDGLARQLQHPLNDLPWAAGRRYCIGEAAEAFGPTCPIGAAGRASFLRAFAGHVETLATFASSFELDLERKIRRRRRRRGTAGRHQPAAGLKPLADGTARSPVFLHG